MIGRWKKEGNQFPSSNKLVQEPEGNERSRLQQNEDKIMPKSPMKSTRTTRKKKSYN
jgi:hypothetical protein